MVFWEIVGIIKIAGIVGMFLYTLITIQHPELENNVLIGENNGKQ